MRKQITIALLCMAVSTPAFSQVYDIAAGIKRTPSYNEQKAERLRNEQLRLENEQLRQEIEQREREAQRQEQLLLQNEARERERAQTAGTDQSTGPDIYEQLRTIGQLRDDGILTEEEF